MERNYVYFKELNDMYNEADLNNIKSNIKIYMILNKLKHDDLPKILGISMHTAYSYTNMGNKFKPSLINLILFATYLELDVFKLLKRYVHNA